VETTELVIPADAAAVAAAIGLARRFAVDMPPRDADRLAIIVEELVENLVEHAAQPPGAVIRLALWMEAQRLWLQLVDEAPPFDPRHAGVTPIPARGGSVGLALVRAWTQIESYDSADGRNVLRLSMPVAA
jgi:anti-sigma regulatory factor (Ser/Thr protein kinase)